MSAPARLGYRPELDALRAIAVSMVMLSHFWFNDSGLGHLGVRLFFVLSGFLITMLLLEHGSMASFYVRRIFRLGPALYLALCLALLFDLDGMRATWKWHLLQITNVLLARLDSWSVVWPADHLWTLNVEEQFYLLWPLVILLVPKPRLPVAFATLIIIAPLYRIAGQLGGWGEVSTLVLPPASFDALGFGALLAVVQLRLRSIALLCAPSLLIIIFNPLPQSFWLKELAELASLPVLGAVIQAGWNGKLGIGCRPLVALGQISYGVYLYHGFLFGVLTKAGWTQRGFTLTVIASGLTIAVAALSYMAFERPVRELGRRISDRLTMSGKHGRFDTRATSDADAS